MIFVTVGTQSFPFERLFHELEILIEKGVINEEVVAQVGKYNYDLKNIETVSYISGEEIDEYIFNANFIITHGGTSSIIKCLRAQKKVIVVPRLQKYGEHVDNHQTEITHLFASRNNVKPVYDIEKLTNAVQSINSQQLNQYRLGGTELKEDIGNYVSFI